jgi:hypothetical protein
MQGALKVSSHSRDPDCRQIYLLNLWREAPEAPWRASLRQAGDAERIGFADLEALALFLLRLNDHQGPRVDRAEDLDHGALLAQGEPGPDDRDR